MADLIEAGRPHRFKPGNQAALNSGRGRPRKSLSQLTDRLSIRGLRLLAKIAFDEAHPWHDEHGFAALLALVKACVPRRREVTGRDGEKLGLVDVHDLVFGRPALGVPAEDDQSAA